MKAPSKTLIKVIQVYDGPNSLMTWISNPEELIRGRQTGLENSIYQRLLSHAVSIGLDVSIVPENSKLIVTVNIKP